MHFSFDAHLDVALNSNYYRNSSIDFSICITLFPQSVNILVTCWYPQSKVYMSLGMLEFQVNMVLPNLEFSSKHNCYA
jgi:hypothetical protein